ncbi:hypothetical protein KBTX_02790 [wastewater metagenome]|uniref:Uncharacterized protein n=2 Tax=unclassified sequences TaxID=12908 RepID=A0A5B8RG48_9ZZZZ|nr:hypothetical protein [Arhodomonas sp. KWT]QEA06452.1 hypothetical protein KBTEX_02790 [uncultured organism]
MASAMQSAAGAFQQGYRFYQDMQDREQQREARADDRQWQKELRSMKRQKFQRATREAERKRDQARAEKAFNGIGYALAQGQAPSADLIKEANDASGGEVMKAFRNVWSPKKRQAVETLKQGVRGQINDQKQLVSAANLVLQPELSDGIGETFKGKDGKDWTVRRKFVRGIVPNPNGDGVMVDLAVEAADDEGNTHVYGAPATEGRSTSEDDSLVQDIPMDKVVGKVSSLDKLSRMVESNPEFRSQLEQLAVSNGVDPAVFTGSGGEYSYQEFKNGDQIETWMIGPGGEPVRRLASSPRWKPDKPSQKEQEVQDLVRRGVPKEWATDVANGNVSTDVDDFGNVIATNRATGEVRNLGRPGRPAGEGAMEDSAAGTGDADNAQQGGVFDDLAEGTGPISNIRSAVGSVIGPFRDGAMFPGTERARSAIRNFNQTAKQALVNSGRFPVYEQKIVAELLPDPDQFWNDPDAARERLNQLRDFLQRKRDMNAQTIQGGNVTNEKRGELANQNAVIDQVVGLMGSPDGTDTQPDNGQSGAGGTPGGESSRAPISSMNLQQLQQLDPGQLSDQELIQANQRFNELRGGE